MVGVVLGFANLFSDIGVNSAFVQRQEVTNEQRSSLFWLNILVSIALTLLIFFFSPFISSYFGDERLTPLIMLSAITLTIGAFGIQVKMAAEKKLQFRSVMLLELSAALLGFIVAITAATAGWGVYALVSAGIITITASTTLAWIFVSDGWRPLWRLRFDEIRSFLGFGGALVITNIVNNFNSMIDLFLGARLLTTAQLGFYSVPRTLALQIQFVINPIITRIGFPLISQVHTDIDQVKKIYSRILNMTSSTNAPIYIGIACFAPDVINIILGRGWGQSTEILRVLALWGGIRSTFNPLGSLLLGMGRADLSLKWNLGLLFIIPPAILWGSMFGAMGMAWAMFGVLILIYIPAWYILVRPLCQLTLSEYFSVTIKPFLIAVSAFIPAYFLAIQVDNSIIRLSVGLISALCIYTALSLITNREWIATLWELRRS